MTPSLALSRETAQAAPSPDADDDIALLLGAMRTGLGIEDVIAAHPRPRGWWRDLWADVLGSFEDDAELRDWMRGRG